MSPCDSLPVILVSAADNTAATTIISDLIDNEIKRVEVGENDCDRIWRFVNKYYMADVKLRPFIDGKTLTDKEDIEAHIIYLSEDECSEDAAQNRLNAAAGAGADGIRLLLAVCEVASQTLQAWARREKYEIVPLRETGPPPDPGEPFPEVYGIQRARSTLHAHIWPGLQRLSGSAIDPAALTALDLDDSSAGEDGEDDWEGSVEDAELFARTLALIPDTRSLPAEQRRERAEQIVAAFCRALGHDLNSI